MPQEQGCIQECHLHNEGVHWEFFPAHWGLLADASFHHRMVLNNIGSQNKEDNFFTQCPYQYQMPEEKPYVHQMKVWPPC